MSTNASTNASIASTNATSTNKLTMNPTWMIYDPAKTPSIGSRAYGYIPLPSGHIFTDWGTATKVTTLPRVVIVKPIEGQKDKLTPTTSMDRDMGTMNPAVGSQANGYWEPSSAGGSGVVHYGLGEVVAVYEDVTILEVKRAGGAVHPESK
ncbi:hypothetical protein BJY00DRAFT_313578 [Aspergillus carlsbadensis]|nr:hypothetical protein BJY00DRAFT_313578 [Aspergillus carlsbadensis]